LLDTLTLAMAIDYTPGSGYKRYGRSFVSLGSLLWSFQLGVLVRSVSAKAALIIAELVKVFEICVLRVQDSSCGGGLVRLPSSLLISLAMPFGCRWMIAGGFSAHG
jgi:hypothetical protein